MLARQRRGHPAGRGRRQPAPLRRRRVRRAGLRLRAAQLHRPGRHAGRGGPGAAGGRAPGRARGRRARPRGSGAPATTSGSPRRSRPSAAPSRTGRPTATCPARWPTSPRPGPAPDAARGRLLRGRDPPPGRRPEPARRRHPCRARRDGRRSTRAPCRSSTGPTHCEFDGSPTVLFDRPGLTLVGWGTARLVEAAEATAALAAIPCDDAVARPRVGRRGARGAALRRRHGRASRDPPLHHGDAHATPTASPGAGPPRSGRPTARSRETDELFDAVIWQYGTTPDVAADPGVAGLTTPDDRGGLRRRGGRGRRRHGRARGHAAQGGAVPTGRRSGSTARSALSAVLRRLRAGEPNCTIFSMPVPDGAFFGASPELLVARHGGRVSCHPLAGTVARGDTARADADAQRDLARSAKNREEHRYVVDGDRGRPRAAAAHELSVPDEPSLVAFRSVAHLGTRIEGQLARPVGGARAPRAAAPDPGRRRHPARRGAGASSRALEPASAGTGPGRSAGSTPAATASG